MNKVKLTMSHPDLLYENLKFMAKKEELCIVAKFNYSTSNYCRKLDISENARLCEKYSIAV